MIAQKQVIWFNGRTPKTREIRIGFEGDNMVDRLEFALPTISAQQTAFLMKSGPEADAITMQSDGARYYVDMTAEIIGTEGERESYVMIRGTDGEEWKSAAFTLITHDVPDISEEIEQRFPTAVEQMLESMAEHRVLMAEQAEMIEQTAAEADAAANKAQDIADRLEGSDFAVKSVNGKTGDVLLTAEDVAADPVGSAASAEKAAKEYADQAIARIPTPDVSGQIEEHNQDALAHPAIRQMVTELTSRLNALADSDDTTLDQLSEIVAYIKSNKNLIDAITTSKVSVSDIVDSLTSSASDKPLSAKQGAALKAMIDALQQELDSIPEDQGEELYIFDVVFNEDFTALTTETTFAMIDAQIKAGKTPICRGDVMGGKLLMPLASYMADAMASFSLVYLEMAIMATFNADGSIEVARLMLAHTGNMETMLESFHLVDLPDRVNKLDIKTERFVTPEQFGAMANGWEDDSAALTDCFAYAVQNQVSVRGYGIYYITKPVTISGQFLDIYLHGITYAGTGYALTISTAYSAVRINNIYCPNGSGINFVNGTSGACAYNTFEMYGINCDGPCIYLGNTDETTQANVTYNVFDTKRLTSANSCCIRAVKLVGGENRFNGNGGAMEAPNDYAFRLEGVNQGAGRIRSTFNIDHYCIENGCKSGFYLDTVKVVAGYIRTRECMDKQRVDSGEVGMMLKMVGGAEFYSDMTHIDYASIDATELSNDVGDGRDVYDEEHISYVKAGRYVNADYYGESRFTFDLPGYIRMTGPHKFLDYEGRQIYHKLTADIDMSQWTILPPNVIDVHANAVFTISDVYGANGINSILIDQTHGYTATVKDSSGKVLFDGSAMEAKAYRLNCRVSGVDDVNAAWIYNPAYDVWELDPQGPKGETPVKGVDYYTEADKTEMVNAVIAALPTWEGGSY